jgi:hypothetical protein
VRGGKNHLVLGEAGVGEVELQWWWFWRYWMVNGVKPRIIKMREWAGVVFGPKGVGWVWFVCVCICIKGPIGFISTKAQGPNLPRLNY